MISVRSLVEKWLREITEIELNFGYYPYPL
jgi:hypothetical protein